MIDGSLEKLGVNPFLMKDMDQTATRLAEIIMSGEKGTIGAIGDYDVDGSTASAIFQRFLAMTGTPLTVHIPDRFREGYGPSYLAVEYLKAKSIKHLVTLDCGTTAFGPLAYAAHEQDMEVMVVDHHEPHGQGVVPEASSIVNANQEDDMSPYNGLSAAGVTYLLVSAIDKKLEEAGWYASHPRPELRSLLDLVALGTVSDVMKLEGVNRVLVSEGLKVMAEGTNLGIRTLLNVYGINRAPIAEDIAFLLGPAINAPGRLEEDESITDDELRNRLKVLPEDLFTLSSLGYRLLTTTNQSEAEFLAERIKELNERRKYLENELFEEAIPQAEAQLAANANAPCLVVYGEHWHQGVMGIVAGRLKEMYGLPVVVAAGVGENVKASARSIEGVDIGRAIIESYEEGWLKAAGGHVMAAGLTMDARNLDGFREVLSHKVAGQVAEAKRMRNLPIHFAARTTDMTGEIVDALAIGEPYGTGNPRPVIMLENVIVDRITPMGTHQNNYRLELHNADDPDGPRLKAVVFRAKDTELGHLLQYAHDMKKPIQLAGSIRINTYKGKDTPQFQIEDGFEGHPKEIFPNGEWEKIIHLGRDFAPLSSRELKPTLPFTRAAIADQLASFSTLMERLLGKNDGTYTISTVHRQLSKRQAGIEL